MIQIMLGLSKWKLYLGGAVAISAALWGAVEFLERRGAKEERSRQTEIKEERSDAIDDAVSGDCDWRVKLRGSCE